MTFSSVETFSKKDLPDSTGFENNPKVSRKLIDCHFKQFLQYQCQHEYKTVMKGEDGKTQITSSKVILDSKKSDFKYICFPFLRLFEDCTEVVAVGGVEVYRPKRIEITEIDSNDELLLTAIEQNRQDILRYHEYK